MSLPLDEVSIKDKEWKVQLLNIKIIIVLHIDSVDLLLHYLNEDDCIEEQLTTMKWRMPALWTMKMKY